MVGPVNLCESWAPFLYFAAYKDPVAVSGDSKKWAFRGAVGIVGGFSTATESYPLGFMVKVSVGRM